MMLTKPLEALTMSSTSCVPRLLSPLDLELESDFKVSRLDDYCQIPFVLRIDVLLLYVVTNPPPGFIQLAVPPPCEPPPNAYFGFLHGGGLPLAPVRTSCSAIHPGIFPSKCRDVQKGFGFGWFLRGRLVSHKNFRNGLVPEAKALVF